MLVVRCEGVDNVRGERLVSERRVTGFVAVADGWLLTVGCVCGEEHALAVRRSPRD